MRKEWTHTPTASEAEALFVEEPYKEPNWMIRTLFSSC